MNYLIWKNRDSRTLKGLIISELPPITKPRMRVQETEVDGLDGSIIEELGYESYDKTVEIGLSRNFDIDEIIEYFTGAGQIVFSNEPDKYYNARIIEQINYERLLRFKTATVTLRVQPFKYKYQEELINVATEETTEILVVNQGNYNSKPIITIKGSGIIEFTVNENTLFRYTFPEEEDTVVIDSQKQDAYIGSILKNRNMSGEFPIFKVGENTITWEGSITNIEISSQSRWL
jgi:predicted phage tail component-like protein